MKKRSIIQFGLIAISLVLAWLILDGIRGPIKFKQEQSRRKDIVVERLKNIRDAQIAYRNVHGKYTASFDTLIDFIENGKIPIIKLQADPNDTTFTKQIIDTVGYAVVKDSIFKNVNFKPIDVKYIPFSGKVEFEMNAGTTVKGNVTVNVIETFAANKYFLKGLDLESHNIDKEDGLRFGSMTEPTTDGNWE